MGPECPTRKGATQPQSQLTERTIVRTFPKFVDLTEGWKRLDRMSNQAVFAIDAWLFSDDAQVEDSESLRDLRT
jgi:hypothetical protein